MRRKKRSLISFINFNKIQATLIVNIFNKKSFHSVASKHISMSDSNRTIKIAFEVYGVKLVNASTIYHQNILTIVR